MNVAEQIIATVQSGAIPILAIMTFLAVISTMRAPGNQISQDTKRFKVSESSFWLMIAFYCAVAAGLFAWLSVTNTEKAQIISNYIMIFLCAVGCVITLYIFFKRKLVVLGELLTYSPIKGKTQTYELKNVSRMEVVQKDYFEEMCVYSKTGVLLFKVQGYMTNVSLLKKYMKENRIRIVKKDLTK